MALLGEDGLGYELARKLEACGVWRTWLGDSNYTHFSHYLSSPSTWESFMNSKITSPTLKTHIHLQLRVRALLFDKASVSLFLRSSNSGASKLNLNYLQLHGDDVYFSLEDFSLHGYQDLSNSTQSKLTTVRLMQIPPKVCFSTGFKYGEPELDDISNRSMRDGFPGTWYNQFIEKYKVSGQHKLLSRDREPHKRTSEGMSTYLKLLERHKKSRRAFKEDDMGFDNPIWDNGTNMHLSSVSDCNISSDDETSFFPEIMFPADCVPDSALPSSNRVQDNPKIECYGVLDSLPHVMTRSPAMLERFGIRPEYLRIGLGRSKYRGKNGLEGNGRSLGQEQAFQMSQQAIVRLVAKVGFEGTTELPVEVLSKFLSSHVCKLGSILKVLTDNYRKQCSAIEILKMFLQTVGYSNLGTLVDHAKDGNRNPSHPTQQQYVRGVQSGLQSQHQNLNFQSQQILRQMNPQMQIPHPQAQNVAFQHQQQWERMRRRQSTAPRAGMSLDKDRTLVEVKLENVSEPLMDVNTFAPSNNRHPQLQFRQQQAPAMVNFHAQSGHPFKQLSSLQVPQLQTQNTVTVRAPPVKVEGFQELMGGDTSLKHDSEENRLTSPSK
ncbi:hypothetical protein IFM89_033974 [Coptis chinensis]|uniref:Bromodomain associated domain-containing protein n=1 Tax=Coptis chinensis TaxID=261450 RepID=A0A835HRY0_9MAGN|nr:hypothetical protein IFM89_033974 [Coptis chinensis]